MPNQPDDEYEDDDDEFDVTPPSMNPFERIAESLRDRCGIDVGDVSGFTAKDADRFADMLEIAALNGGALARRRQRRAKQLRMSHRRGNGQGSNDRTNRIVDAWEATGKK